jgi:cysteine-S-conjugate beta-lyase
MPSADSRGRRAFLHDAAGAALLGAVAPSAAAALPAAAAVNGRYDFDTPLDRFGTDCVKFDKQIKEYGKDSIVVGMGIADMDFRTAPAITQALQERMRHENWGYLDLPRSFAETIAAWNKRRYGIDVDPDTIVVACGVHPAIIAALHTFSPPGSKVLLQTPTYNGFYGDLSFARVVPEESPLRLVDGRYQMDFDDLERRISHDTHTLILCNPQNPTGNCWTKDDLLRVGEICLRRRVVVLADEIHCDFVCKGQSYTPFSSLPDKAIVNNSITFKAASKSFSLAAMKCGWFFSTNADYLARVKANHRAELTTLGMIASRAAYTGGEAWLDQVVSYIEGNLDLVDRFVRTRMPLVRYVKPQGTFLAWLDVSAVAERIGAPQQAAEANRKKAAAAPLVTPEKIVEQYFVKRARVHLNAGNTYGKGGENHVRMNVATSRKQLQLALDNMAGALATL